LGSDFWWCVGVTRYHREPHDGCSRLSCRDSEGAESQNVGKAQPRKKLAKQRFGLYTGFFDFIGTRTFRKGLFGGRRTIKFEIQYIG